MQSLRGQAQNLVRRFGWELRRLHPDLGLDTYLWFLFPHLGVNCVLDVGARFGEFASTLRQLGYKGRIVSFEPVGANMLEMRRRFAGDPGWRGVQAALGRTAGQMTINVAAGSNFSSFRTATQYGRQQFAGIAVEREEPVAVHRLDDVFAEAIVGIAEPRVYLKLDTQGWDLEVLQGASGCLETIVAAQSEMSLQPLYEGIPSYVEAITAFREAGLDVSGIFPLARDEEMRLVEFDCVLVKRGVRGLRLR